MFTIKSLKGKFTPKLKLSLFTHPHVQTCFLNTKEGIYKISQCFFSSWDPVLFGPEHYLKYSSVPQKKESLTGLERHKSE